MPPHLLVAQADIYCSQKTNIECNSLTGDHRSSLAICYVIALILKDLIRLIVLNWVKDRVSVMGDNGLDLVRYDRLDHFYYCNIVNGGVAI
jgi:hypothetical protein